MGLSKQRQEELDQLGVEAYRQIAMDRPLSEVRSRFEDRDLTDDEIDWIVANGKERYQGYNDHLRAINRGTARSFVLGGLALLIGPYLFVEIFGEPNAGRQIGMLGFAKIAGIGALLYGAYCWVTADPEGVRSDLD